MPRLLASNLIDALDLAITAKSEIESLHVCKSAQLQGWLDIRNALARGERVELVPLDPQDRVTTDRTL